MAQFQPWGVTSHTHVQPGGWYAAQMQFDRPVPMTERFVVSGWPSLWLLYAGMDRGQAHALELEPGPGFVDADRPENAWLYFRYAGRPYPIEELRQSLWDFWWKTPQIDDITLLGVSIYEHGAADFDGDSAPGTGTPRPGTGGGGSGGGSSFGGSGRGSFLFFVLLILLLFVILANSQRRRVTHAAPALR